MSTEILSPFPIFTDLDGEPLEAGYIWIGVENLPPQTNPKTVYADSALSIQLAQPIRTEAGAAVANGTPTPLYVSGNYSVLVQNKTGELVYSRALVQGDVQASLAPTSQSFNGNGVTVAFMLGSAPVSAAALVVRISGAVQTPGVDYTVSGTVLTFTEAPPTGTGNIVVQNFGYAVPVGAAPASGISYPDASTLDQYIGPVGSGASLEVNPATDAVTAIGALIAAGALTLSAGTANGVVYLNGSKVASSGSALTFDGTNAVASGNFSAAKFIPTGNVVTGVGMYLPAADTIGLSTAGVEAMRIDPSQRVGIGVTPFAWNTTYSVLDIGPTFGMGVASGTLFMLNNGYLDAAAYRYKVGSQEMAMFSMSSGTFQFYTAPTGLAGAAATLTERLRLSRLGNLGLGTSTFGTSAETVFSMATGVAPSTAPVDTVQMFSNDLSAGNTILGLRCEGSGVTGAGITNVTVTHKIALRVNGTVYYLLATTNAT